MKSQVENALNEEELGRRFSLVSGRCDENTCLVNSVRLITSKFVKPLYLFIVLYWCHGTSYWSLEDTFFMHPYDLR